eukprot:scaffold223038_cov17-Prasinocladus_malaysianus.AAC.1
MSGIRGFGRAAASSARVVTTTAPAIHPQAGQVATGPLHRQAVHGDVARQLQALQADAHGDGGLSTKCGASVGLIIRQTNKIIDSCLGVGRMAVSRAKAEMIERMAQRASIYQWNAHHRYMAAMEDSIDEMKDKQMDDHLLWQRDSQ